MVELITAPWCLLVFVHRSQGKILEIYFYTYYGLGLVSVLTHSGLSQVLVLVSVVLTTKLIHGMIIRFKNVTWNHPET